MCLTGKEEDVALRKAVVILLFFAMFLGIRSVAQAVVFLDDFSFFDTNKWDVKSGSVGTQIQIADADSDSDTELFLSRRNNIRARIHSKDRFSYGILEADIIPNGIYQKFGLGVNAGEWSGIDRGFYFDTLNAYYGGGTDTISWVVYNGSQYIHGSISGVLWNQWHHLAINWQPSTVTFIVDGNIKKEYSITYSGTLPIGIYNDRDGSYYVDDVRYNTPSVVPEPSSIFLTLFGLFGIVSGRKK